MHRVITKIGDIYSTLNGEFFQLVAIDQVQLGGDVIVYYGKVDPDEIPNVPIKFYHHITVSQGIKMGIWSKAGKKPLPDLSKLIFKQLFDEDLGIDDIRIGLIKFFFKPRPYWTVWTPLDSKWKKISYKKGLDLEAESGDIAPATELEHRIKYGVSGYQNDWPKR
jgi:hypothetical protein